MAFPTRLCSVDSVDRAAASVACAVAVEPPPAGLRPRFIEVGA
ncbi:hypothetical protein AB3662_01980 [Sorangium cellulosum]